jgi:hypothetical protein
MAFEVMSRQCSECLFSDRRIVSAKRASEIIKKCRRMDNSFECHKGSLADRHIACRGHFETGVGQMARIAGRLGMVLEIDPDTLPPTDASTTATGPTIRAGADAGQGTSK